MPDYLPRNEGDQILWLNNLKTKLPDQESALGLTPAKVAEIIALADGIIQVFNAKTVARTAYDEAVANADAVRRANFAALRSAVARWKTEPGYTDALGASLGLVATPENVDPDTLKPDLTVVLQSGHVQLRFRKYGADAVNLYKRKAGETTWKFLARDTNSPYDDFSLLTTPGVPENWEYRALAVLGDTEAGQPSDIVRVTFGG